MTTVSKYPLPLADVVSLTMPRDADVLYVAVQAGTICLWARVDPHASTELRHFRIARTEHELTGDVGLHRGSVLLQGGELELHVFDLLKVDP